MIFCCRFALGDGRWFGPHASTKSAAPLLTALQSSGGALTFADAASSCSWSGKREGMLANECQGRSRRC
eukprot:11596996-Alexandrium_andersonii.AAC.1